jgi:hypothetical protein
MVVIVVIVCLFWLINVNIHFVKLDSTCKKISSMDTDEKWGNADISNNQLLPI